MSIAFDSGGRQRPVAVARDDGEEIVIDGTRLKQLRIERGLSVADAARLVTLSREQIEQIENGGLGAFYGARHKLLAVRKYAEGFGLTLEELLPKPAPVPEPAPEPTPAAASAPVMASIQQTGADADSAVAGEAAIEDFVAPIGPAPLNQEAPSVVVSRDTDDQHAAVSSTISETSLRRLPLALLVGVALVLVFSILRGLTPEQAPTELPPVEPATESTSSETPSAQSQAEPAAQTPAAITPDVTAATPPAVPVATTSPVPAAAGSTSSPSSTQVATPAQSAPSAPPATAAVTAAATPTNQQAHAASANDACALTAGPDTPRWAPAQGRNSSTRVFVTSSAPIDVCVTDANGIATPLKVKPGAMFSASGKPPYVVRSERLSQAQIFLQGLKVRVPSSATSVHLITTPSVRSPETPVPEAQ